MTDFLHIEISIQKQSLKLFQSSKCIDTFSVSTAANGPGELMDSECTPRGRHIIAEKIGEGCHENTVFIGRKATNEMYSHELKKKFPERDWILTRILWLSGCEEGKNKNGIVDSYDRYIYIHGTPDDNEMGKPGSRGCIRMRNHELIRLFNRVRVGTEVNIRE